MLRKRTFFIINRITIILDAAKNCKRKVIAPPPRVLLFFSLLKSIFNLTWNARSVLIPPSIPQPKRAWEYFIAFHYTYLALSVLIKMPELEQGLEQVRGSTFQMEISFHQHLFHLIGFRSVFYQPRKCLFNKYSKQIFISPLSSDFFSVLFILIFLLIQIFNEHFKREKKKTFQFVSFVLSRIFLWFSSPREVVSG